MKLDPFYLIVDSARLIEDLVPLGVKLVQLRIKHMDEAGLRREIRRSIAICAAHDCTLVINDYWQIAIEEGADFVHLGQEDLIEADLERIHAANIRFGLSTHDESELEKALATKPDYIALGPIYETILKKMTFAPQGLARISAWKQRIGDLPLVAIGGLNLERLEGVFAHGADSAAVVTDIINHPDPVQRTRDWLKATEGQR